MQMRRVPKEFIMFSYLLLGLTCCTPVLTVRSSPTDANVFLLTDNGNRQPLGQTPLNTSYSELEKYSPLASVTGELITISVEKENYEEKMILIPMAKMGLSSATVQVRLKSVEDGTATADQLLQWLHNAQKFANGGNYPRAIEEVDKAIGKNPKFIRGLSMKGSIYFVQGQFDESLVWYEKALALDSGFDEAVKMIAEIKRKKDLK